ncbi:MAG: monofunctional biosynthetic peptidoglycan transglycosylase [Spirochaetae bacterium HGW-Spirochaetae-7]|jgi:monofunctional biosynthetic peptidoglycan transglycosylase|nr:MAG: monofunctional biosynthetic peptidoglycan transglycosylase [Spirochaetae bacterium HGW-Spirochaetae-7]
MTIILFNRAIRRSTRALRIERGDLLPAPKPRSPLVRAFYLASRVALRSVVLFHLWYVGVTALVVVCFAFVDPAATTLSMYRKYVDGWKVTRPIPISMARVPKTARRMLVSVEDSTFFSHHGIEFEAFQRAIEINQQIGRPMYGGSTLTMQTARTLFLVPFKSYLRKYLELIVTFELELFLPKERILELYFSWAEWGKGVFGIEAASRKYFGVSVTRLDPTQTASLIAVLSSPIRFVPSTLAKSRILSSRYEFLLDRYVR